MPGFGRGDAILYRLKQKEAEERAQAAAQISLSRGPMASGFPGRSSDQERVPETIAFASASSIGTGRGRAGLHSLIQTMKSTQDKPTLISSPVGQGRASLLALSKKLHLPGQQHVTEEQRISTHLTSPVQQNVASESRGVLGRLSDLTISDSKDISKSSIQHPQPIHCQGTSGQPISLSANYLNIRLDPGKGLYQYEVKFSPDIDSIGLRRKVINQCSETLGKTKTFDGTLLYLPQKLESNDIVLKCAHPVEGSPVTVTIIFKKEQDMHENVQFFNVLLARVMRALELVRIGRQSFNPKCAHPVPQHRLEVWPGYVTAINKYEGGLKLCIDAKHRVMRTDTVRELMIGLERKGDFRRAVINEIIGISVLTRYNNRTYRIDDIAWDKNPHFVFKTQNGPISLIQYYKTHWNLVIKDTEQPLLLHCAKEKLPTGETEEKQILLVPELCYVTGLTNNIRSDFKVMRDLSSITQVSPSNRRDVIKRFVQEVQANEVTKSLLSAWGLYIENELTTFTGRVLDPEKIFFGQDKSILLTKARPVDWSAASVNNPVLRTISLRNWYIIFTERDRRCAKEFVSMLQRVSTAMGMEINGCREVCLKNDSTESFVRELRKNIDSDIELMVIVFPTNRSDRYAAVKKVCCVEMPIPSQVIMANTISRGDKLKSITQKIALQINCKLGGALWALRIPLDDCMICGIDVHHAGIGQGSRGSVVGFVASLDKPLTKWHSKICLQGRRQELIDLLQICLISAIQAYRKHNGNDPQRIIVYRDGVGDGELETVVNYEVKQLLTAIKTRIDPSYDPGLTIIVVQKRINTRIFLKMASTLENPPPGTIVDTCITKQNMYDFFLVSQNVRHGTVTPTHYIVVYDNKNMKADHLQSIMPALKVTLARAPEKRVKGVHHNYNPLPNKLR
ncbi:hypothetical protein KM043_008597 [Ampulex compressa]|nr:hypothetical protein KM043_008597 [Ampulex compressa]